MRAPKLNIFNSGGRSSIFLQHGITKMRPFYCILYLTSWQLGSAFLTVQQCSKRLLHTPPSSIRKLKTSSLSELPETSNRNFITNIIEGDIKENKVQNINAEEYTLMIRIQHGIPAYCWWYTCWCICLYDTYLQQNDHNNDNNSDNTDSIIDSQFCSRNAEQYRRWCDCLF